MMVEITLNDDEGNPLLKLTNCDDPETVSLMIDENWCRVSIEELRSALRKMTTK